MAINGLMSPKVPMFERTMRKGGVPWANQALSYDYEVKASALRGRPGQCVNSSSRNQMIAGMLSKMWLSAGDSMYRWPICFISSIFLRFPKS